MSGIKFRTKGYRCTKCGALVAWKKTPEGWHLYDAAGDGTVDRTRRPTASDREHVCTAPLVHAVACPVCKSDNLTGKAWFSGTLRMTECADCHTHFGIGGVA